MYLTPILYHTFIVKAPPHLCSKKGNITRCDELVDKSSGYLYEKISSDRYEFLVCDTSMIYSMNLPVINIREYFLTDCAFIVFDFIMSYSMNL